MRYQVVYPVAVPVDIYGDSFKEAVKNYVKMNSDMTIRNLIIKDQADHYEARLRYYTENNKNKVGIDVYPYTNINGPYAVYGDNKLRMPLGSSIVAPVSSITNVMSPVVVNPYVNPYVNPNNTYSNYSNNPIVNSYLNSNATSSVGVNPFSNPIIVNSNNPNNIMATSNTVIAPVSNIWSNLARLFR